MSKKQNKKRKRKSKKNYTPIAKQRRIGSKLRTAATDLNFDMIDWEKDLMPEYIWIDLLAESFKDRHWHLLYNQFVDKIDDCIENEWKTPFLGLISDFGMLTESERENFLKNNEKMVFDLFYQPIGKILTLYPDNPAGWVALDKWKDREKINFETELKRLGKSLSRLIKAKDLYAGNIRSIPLRQLFKHNKLFFAKEKFDDLVEILPKYPVNCSEEEQYKVQSYARTILNLNHMTEKRYKRNKWAKYFWRHNLDLVPCYPINRSLKEGDLSKDDKIKDLQKRLWDNSVILMKYVDKIGMQYKYDLYDPKTDEIKLGLFSRIVRLYISFISNPFFWTQDLAGIFLRCIGETTIIFFYLTKKGSKEEFNNFYNYSLGKEKLLMLHMQDHLDEKKSVSGESISDLSQNLGGEFIAEIQEIELKGWTKKNIRELALSVGLENIYRWVVDPSSAEIHGSWSSLRKSNLVVCSQILHRFHKIPKFFEPPIFLIPMFVANRIYEICEELAINELGCPTPDEEMKEIPEITAAFNKVFEKFE